MSIKVFHPQPGGDSPADARPLRLRSPARVVELTAETDVDSPPELPLHLAGAPGTVALQLRSTVRRVAMGAGLARDTALYERVRALPEVPALTTSPAGGTFIVGGPAWLGLCAVGVPPTERVMPLDWMMDSLRAWFEQALALYGVHMQVGRVDGAWCPGFSDIAVDGRKLIGLGFRVTKDWVVMRGVMPVQPISAEDQAVLRAVHALIGVEVRAEMATSLAEAANDASLTVAQVMQRWQSVATR